MKFDRKSNVRFCPKADVSPVSYFGRLRTLKKGNKIPLADITGFLRPFGPERQIFKIGFNPHFARFNRK